MESSSTQIAGACDGGHILWNNFVFNICCSTGSIRQGRSSGEGICREIENQRWLSMRRITLLSAFMLVLALLFSEHSSVAAAAKQPVAAVQAGQTQNGSALPPGYVGSQMCEACHTDIAHGFSNNPHAKMVLLHGDKNLTCENCHGPGQAHVQGGGDIHKIFTFSNTTPQEINKRCLACHSTAHPDFLRSPHAKAGLSCISCHSVHHSTTSKFLLTESQPRLCETCHSDVKAQFAMPFHHPVPEGEVKCSDCHDVHGTFNSNNLRSTADQNRVCTKCHTDVRGPFVFEHAAVKGVGCLGCHSPHGSQNARLLNMPNVNVLCNQCHSPVAAGTFHSMGQGSSEIEPCTNCHTEIHGSNINAAFIR